MSFVLTALAPHPSTSQRRRPCCRAPLGATQCCSIEIDLPAGAKPTIDRDFVIANITAPSGLRASDDAEDEGAEEAEAETEE